MKKKQYIKPETVVVEAKLDNLLYQTSVPYGGDNNDDPDESKKGFFDDEEETDMEEPSYKGGYWDVVGTE